jgi:periplasmic protein TonB
VSEELERRNQRISFFSSLGIHVGLLLLFVFVMGWKAPDPPLSEYGSGVELNLGIEAEGGGDVQQETAIPAGPQTPENTEQPAAKTSEEPKDASTTPPVEAKEDVSSKTLTTTDESPVEVKDVKESKKEAKKTEPAKEKVEVSKDKPEHNVKIAKSDGVVAPKPVDASKKGGGGVSQGDDKGKTGDKGSPEGSLDPNGQYTGKPGTGGNGGGGNNGFALQMAGWNWDAQPQAPRLPDNDNGRIVFEIEVDSDGEIIRITTLERGLSPEAERICRQEIQKRSLVKTSDGKAPSSSKGRITFVLKTR